MRKALMGATFVGALALGGCSQLSDTLSSIFSVFKVDFSLDEDKPVAYGIQLPSVFSNSLTQSLANGFMARSASYRAAGRASATEASGLLGILGFNSVEDILSQTNLDLKFNINADNSKNSDRANFPFASALNLFVRDVGAGNSPTTTGSISPFKVSGKSDTTLQIPVSVPLSLLTGNAVSDVVDGKAIPYRVAGKMAFALQSPTGDTLGKDTASMDLKTGDIPTRPESNAAAFDFFGKVLNFLGV